MDSDRTDQPEPTDQERTERPGTTERPTGDGGPLGTPGQLADEEPPSQDQDQNAVVSGGGVVDPDEDSLTPGESSTDVD